MRVPRMIFSSVDRVLDGEYSRRPPRAATDLPAGHSLSRGCLPEPACPPPALSYPAAEDKQISVYASAGRVRRYANSRYGSGRSPAGHRARTSRRTRRASLLNSMSPTGRSSPSGVIAEPGGDWAAAPKRRQTSGRSSPKPHVALRAVQRVIIGFSPPEGPTTWPRCGILRWREVTFGLTVDHVATAPH